MFGRGRSSPWRKTLSQFGTRVRKELVVETGTIPQEKVPLPMDTLLRGKKPMWNFHNIGNLLRPLELVPISRESRRSPWRVYIKINIDSRSSASVSAMYADQ